MSTTYEMTIKYNGTRLRIGHNTFADVITSYNANSVASGTELWEAPEDGTEVKKGDLWLYVTKIDGNPINPGWMAFTHKGVSICTNLKIIEGEVGNVFPSSFVLTTPQGSKAEYVFSRVLP